MPERDKYGLPPLKRPYGLPPRPAGDDALARGLMWGFVLVVLVGVIVYLLGVT